MHESFTTAVTVNSFHLPANEVFTRSVTTGSPAAHSTTDEPKIAEIILLMASVNGSWPNSLMRNYFVEGVKIVVGDWFVELGQERRVRWDWGGLG